MATQNKPTKWYSPKGLADMADNGFLAAVRSTGAVIRGIEVGSSKTMSVVAKPWRKKEPDSTESADRELEPREPESACEDVIMNRIGKSASDPAAQAPVDESPAGQYSTEQGEQGKKERVELLVKLATEAGKARSKELDAPPANQDREKDQTVTTPRQKREKDCQESKPIPNGALAEKSPVEIDAESAEAQPATPQQRHQEKIEPEKKEKMPKQAIDIDALLASQPQRDRVEALKLRVAVIEFSKGQKEAVINAQQDLISIGRDAEPFFVAVLERDDPMIVELALDGLARIGSALFIPCLAEVFSSPISDVRLIALRSLQRLEDEEAKPLFTRAASDPSPEVRMRVVSYLTWRRSLWAMELVRELCDDLKPQVKWAAIEAMVYLQPDMARDLIERTPPADGDSVYRRRIEMLFEKKATKIKEKIYQAKRKAKPEAKPEAGQAEKKAGRTKRGPVKGKQAG